MRGSHEKCGPGIVKWPVSCSPTFSSQVTDILHFLSAKEDAPVRFIVASEATNFRHLYLIQATPPPLSTGDSTGEPPLVISKATLSVQQLTTGDWIVFGSDVSRHVEGIMVVLVGAVTHTYVPLFHSCGSTKREGWCTLREMQAPVWKNTCTFTAQISPDLPESWLPLTVFSYAVSLNGELPCATPTQLTRPGFYHTTTMDKVS